MKPVPILIDTDPGVDDFFCIAIGCAFRELFDLKAITTIGGNNTTEVTTKNALNILKLLHRDEAVLQLSHHILTLGLRKHLVVVSCRDEA